ncbi:AraC family transcriptional regulator [Novosphingobium sp. Gsoil 351]|uniref:AraC family transcriptional regulator n=1 Tax=Novosphingobium sp. Gsoil 351 TaxID=2675225 RepID=UPI0012B4B553|nr:AraC family transcriptional regulator [Novosphingobium sp. Gsoil 351]QGN55024.1 helix-turn-helix domain-containing protein [Novosphingobium sp. Gsoil 351]
MDPFVDFMRLLRPRATLSGGVEASGRWAIGYAQDNELVFCRIAHGSCQLLRPGHDPIALVSDDFVLIRTVAPFILASGPSITPVDSRELIEIAKGRIHKTVRIGDGIGGPVGLRAGKFLFDTANANFLNDLLPALIHVRSNDTALRHVRSLLALNEAEAREPGPGSEFIIVRLIELVLVDILRSQAADPDQKHGRLLAGLTDPVTAKALSSLHGNVAHAWTLAELARTCGVSRSTLAARFRQTIDMGPMEYLLRWRMALAKDELRTGRLTIGQIAEVIGFQSSSAFSTAFSRTEGCPPKDFRSRVRSEESINLH